MKKLTAMILLFTILLCGCARKTAEGTNQDVLRLHVIANSDSAEDQEVKLYVRDKILAYMQEYDPSDKEEAMAFVKKNTRGLELVAQNALMEKGLDYGVKAEVGVFSFPARDYGGAYYPAGEYDALKIKLGEAQGQNWWCVMFPPLCLTDISYAEKLDREREEGILADTEVEVQYESLLVRLWKALFGKED